MILLILFYFFFSIDFNSSSFFYIEKIPYLYLNFVDQFSFIIKEYGREDLYQLSVHISKFLMAVLMTVPLVSVFSFISTYLVQIHFYGLDTVKRSAESVGLIFFINTIGAISGSALFAFYLIPIIRIRFML